MSKIISGQITTDKMVRTLSKNENNVSAFKVVCICGKSLGTPGQYRPEDSGRRIIACDELTPEQVAALLRRQGNIINPGFFRTTKGCGAITVLSRGLQVEKVFQKGDEAHARLKASVDATKKRREEEERFRLLQERQDETTSMQNLTNKITTFGGRR